MSGMELLMSEWLKDILIEQKGDGFYEPLDLELGSVG